MRAVNLLPREEKKARTRPGVVAQLALAAPFVVAGLLAAGFLLASSSVNNHRSTLQALQHELAALPKPTPVQQGNPALITERNERIAAVGTALQGRLVWDRVLRQISAVLPGDVWLTSLSGQSPPAPPPPAPTSTTSNTTTTTTTTTSSSTPAPAPAPTGGPITFQGYTYSQEGVARLLSRLLVVPALQDVKLVSSTQSTVNDQTVYSFSIEATVRSPGDRMSKLPTLAKLALVAAGVLVAVVAGWFLVISPKRSDVSDLKGQIADTRDQIAVAQGVRPVKPTPSIRIAELFKLSRAMPDTVDVPGLMLQLSRIAGDTGVTFESITPHDPVPYGSYQQVDVDLTFEGRFYDLSDFLYRLRNLVGVHDGALNATGRLFSVNSIQFSQGQDEFPQVKASLTVSAYVFGDGVASPVPGGTAPTGTAPPGTGTPTSATPAIASSQPIPAAPVGATAAGA